MGYAVVDFETTGILPSYHHRVVEIGVTRVDDDGAITERWETLVNPGRDLGPQDIHGIRAWEIFDAPLFSDVAAEFADLLRGHVFVAHNASFDLRFLEAEFERAGYWLHGGTPSLCTMSLGKHFGLGGGCSRSRACSIHGIDGSRAHSAGADSYATAQLLVAYRRASAAWPGWDAFWRDAVTAAGEYDYPTCGDTRVPCRVRAATDASPPSFLAALSAEARHERADDAAAVYLALIDRCLLDGHVSVSEGRQLAEVADILGLGRPAVEELHRGYYRDLHGRAWADGVLTESEKADLAIVASLLQVDIEAAEQAASVTVAEFVLRPGDQIVLTGDMRRDRSDWQSELRSHGFNPHTTVTKATALVAAADPDSLSGKAKKARQYGIPIVSEDGLIRLLRDLDA